MTEHAFPTGGLNLFGTPTTRDTGGEFAFFTDPLTGQLRRRNRLTGEVTDAFETVVEFDEELGEFFRRQVPVLGALPADQGGDGSFSTNLSLQDPAALQIRREQLEAEIQNAANDLLLDLDNLDIARDKLRIAEERNLSDDVFRNKQLVEQINGRVEQRQSRMAELRQQGEQFRASMAARGEELQSREEQASLDRSLRIAELAENARQANVRERRLLANDIAAAAAEPIDVIRSAALEQQAGGISTAIGQGQSAITDQGLAPLQMLLDAQSQLGQQSQIGQALQRGQAAPQEEELTPEEIERNRLQRQGNFQRGAINLITRAAGGAEIGTGPDSTQLIDLLADAGVLQRGVQDISGNPEFTIGGDAEFDASLIDIDEEGNPFLREAEHGGLFNNPVVVGDDSQGKENRELAVSQSPILVIPIGEDENPGGVPKAQTGGLFSAGTVVSPEEAARMREAVGRRQLLGGATSSGTTQATAGAQSFLSAALARVLERIREAGLVLPDRPTPVSVSAPGTSPDIQQIAAGISAGQTGFGRRSFLREAASLRPRGVFGGPSRRTA